MKVMIIADNPTIPSGYGKIAFNIAKQLLRKNIEVAFIGLQYSGSPCYVKIGDKFIKMYMGSITYAFDRAFEDFKPDVAIHIRDAFAHCPSFFKTPYSFIVFAKKYGIKTILYTPVQSDNIPDEFVNACNKEADFVLTFTNWAKEQLIIRGVPFNRIEHLPLGIDTEIYKPMNVNKEDFGFPNKKIVGCIGIPEQYRKAYPILLRAISEVRKKYDVELYIHSAMLGFYHLPHFIESLGLKGYVAFPRDYNQYWGLEEEELAELINCFDVYASATIAEGWDLPAFESLACGVPAVVTDFPNHREVLGELGFYVKSLQYFPTSWSFEWIPDYKDMAEKIIEAINIDKDKYREKALKYVENYTWDKIVEKLLKIIGENFGI